MADRSLLCEIDLFAAGQDGYHTYRIPALITTPKGTVLAFCEGRKNGPSDAGDIDLVMKRSRDGGLTWSPLHIIWDDGPNTVGNPCCVIDRASGAIWLLLTHNLGEDTEVGIGQGTSQGTRTVWVTQSPDEGETWSPPREITQTVKARDWTWYATGPGIGIQTRTGRLIIPCDHAVASDAPRSLASHIIYSDDHGKHWRLGGVAGDHTNECQVVELSDGSLLLNMRSYHGQNRRAIARSQDGGRTWPDPAFDEALVEPVCQASLLRYEYPHAGTASPLLFSNPAGVTRDHMMVRLSEDEGVTWPKSRLLWEGPAAYSCLAVMPDGAVGCLSSAANCILTGGSPWRSFRWPGCDRPRTSGTPANAAAVVRCQPWATPRRSVALRAGDAGNARVAPLTSRGQFLISAICVHTLSALTAPSWSRARCSGTCFKPRRRWRERGYGPQWRRSTRSSRWIARSSHEWRAK